MKQFTKDQAIAFYDSGAWKEFSYRQIAELQMENQFLCVPFDVFQEAMVKTLGRPVFTHEFGLNIEGLRQELYGEKKASTLQEIVELIPEEKRILILIREEA